MMIEIYRMPVEWGLSIVVSCFKGKGYIRNFSYYRAVKLNEHGLKVVETVLEKRLHGIVSVDEMQFGFMSEIGTVDVVLIMRRMQEEYHAKGKRLYVSCEPRESIRQSTEESVEMGIEEERNTRHLG